jgi:hypothetical protein
MYSRCEEHCKALKTPENRKANFPGSALPLRERRCGTGDKYKRKREQGEEVGHMRRGGTVLVEAALPNRAASPTVRKEGVIDELDASCDR